MADEARHAIVVLPDGVEADAAAEREGVDVGEPVAGVAHRHERRLVVGFADAVAGLPGVTAALLPDAGMRGTPSGAQPVTLISR